MAILDILASHVALLVVAMLAATILPGSSEAMLLVLAVKEPTHTATLTMAATVGNTLGAVINWCLGRWLLRYIDRPWFPVSAQQLDRASRVFRKYGLWSLLFSWIPIIGDPLTVAAGMLRTPFPMFLLLTGTGKLVRYLVLIGSLEIVQRSS